MPCVRSWTRIKRAAQCGVDDGRIEGEVVGVHVDENNGYRGRDESDNDDLFENALCGLGMVGCCWCAWLGKCVVPATNRIVLMLKIIESKQGYGIILRRGLGGSS